MDHKMAHDSLNTNAVTSMPQAREVDLVAPPAEEMICSAVAALCHLRQQRPWSWILPRQKRRSEYEQNPVLASSSASCGNSVPPPDMSLACQGDLENGHNHLAQKANTVFYLAYGSNLSKETFLGKRGIHPLSAVNVVVPSLRLTFDLPGIPYSEPCFANSGIRNQDSDDDHRGSITFSKALTSSPTEKTPLLSTPASPPPKYHKDHWLKGLVGVVYELTPADLAHVIATEGGGAAYHDIIVPCFPLRPTDATVPWHPTTEPIISHTLFAPAAPPNVPPGQPSPGGGRFTRPDPAYAQPSARYLKLISDGAAEHGLPQEYRDFIADIRPYRTTTQGTRLGQYIFLTLWTPIVAFIFMVQGMFSDKRGRSPQWLVQFTAAIFVAVWASYDNFFKPTFGDGERTVGDDDDDEPGSKSRLERDSTREKQGDGIV